jgi:hypothetical protein
MCGGALLRVASKFYLAVCVVVSALRARSSSRMRCTDSSNGGLEAWSCRPAGEVASWKPCLLQLCWPARSVQSVVSCGASMAYSQFMSECMAWSRGLGAWSCRVAGRMPGWLLSDQFGSCCMVDCCGFYMVAPGWRTRSSKSFEMYGPNGVGGPGAVVL